MQVGTFLPRSSWNWYFVPFCCSLFRMFPSVVRRQSTNCRCEIPIEISRQLRGLSRPTELVFVRHAQTRFAPLSRSTLFASPIKLLAPSRMFSDLPTIHTQCKHISGLLTYYYVYCVESVRLYLELWSIFNWAKRFHIMSSVFPVLLHFSHKKRTRCDVTHLRYLQSDANDGSAALA